MLDARRFDTPIIHCHATSIAEHVTRGDNAPMLRRARQDAMLIDMLML